MVNQINFLKSLSMNLLKIHKICMDAQFKDIETKSGALNPNQKLELLLHGPDFEWMRPLSQLTSLIDGVIFQKEKIRDTQISQIKGEMNKLFISGSNIVFAQPFAKFKNNSTEVQALVKTAISNTEEI